MDRYEDICKIYAMQMHRFQQQEVKFHDHFLVGA